MDNRKKSKKHNNSGCSSDSDSSNNDVKSEDEVSENSGKVSKRKTDKGYKKRQASSGEEDEQRERKYRKQKDSRKTDKSYDRKSKYEDTQKSKWDSPTENTHRNNDRRQGKEQRSRRYSDRDDGKETRKYREDRRDDYRNKHFHNASRNYKNNRYNRERETFDRRQDDDRYRSDRRRSREESTSRNEERGERREDSRHRGNRRQRQDSPNNYEWGRKDETSSKKPVAEKEKPNFGLSGKLTEDTNTFRGVVIKYSQPVEARKPKRRWRLYPFKGEKALPTLYIHRESAYLMGRDRKIADFPLDHPSCSKQHAVLQYRLVPFTRDDGSAGKRVRPYLIDLESANGTFVNNKKIESKKYVELLEKDVIKFGYSSREYVLLHENSKDEAMDDDVKQEEEDGIKEEPKD